MVAWLVTLGMYAAMAWSAKSDEIGIVVVLTVVVDVVDFKFIIIAAADPATVVISVKDGFPDARPVRDVVGAVASLEGFFHGAIRL